MTTEQFALYYKKWAEPIRDMARQLSRRDRDLADDLEQEGLCTLAAYEPKGEVENEEAFLRTMLYRRMCNVLRAERRAAALIVPAEDLSRGPMLRLESGDDPPERHARRPKRRDDPRERRGCPRDRHDAPNKSNGLRLERGGGDEEQRDDLAVGSHRLGKGWDRPGKRQERQGDALLPQRRNVPRHEHAMPLPDES